MLEAEPTVKGLKKTTFTTLEDKGSSWGMYLSTSKKINFNSVSNEWEEKFCDKQLFVSPIKIMIFCYEGNICYKGISL